MRNTFVIAVLFLAFACTQEKQGTFSRRAFYYWQTSIYDFDWGDSVYQAMDIDKLYVRAFDVDWSEESRMPVPVSPLGFYLPFADTATEIVPVVFITNETFKNLDHDQSVALATQVHKKVMRDAALTLVPHPYVNWGDWWEQDPYRIQSRHFNEQQQHDSAYDAGMKRLREVQFDCDWTKTTKDKYFAFLEQSKKLFSRQLVSSTIRLYQYKYPNEAGLPPVKRGMLMCYNAGDVKDPESVNSIFDKDEVMSYLKSDAYPIPLDYALPIFDWALLYSHNELKAILSSVSLRNEYSGYVETIDPAHLRVTDDFVYGHMAGSLYIRKGDEIRMEKPDMEQVEDVARWLAGHKNNPEAVLTFYHLNNHDFQEHLEAIEAIFNSF